MPGHLEVDAADEIAAPAGRAAAAVAAVPPDPDPLPDLPRHDPGAEGVDPAGHLVARHGRGADAGEGAVLPERVAVADAAGLDPDPHLAGAGLRHLALDQLERRARLAHLPHPHPCHRRLLVTWTDVPELESGSRSMPSGRINLNLDSVVPQRVPVGHIRRVPPLADPNADAKLVRRHERLADTLMHGLAVHHQSRPSARNDLPGSRAGQVPIVTGDSEADRTTLSACAWPVPSPFLRSKRPLRWSASSLAFDL